MTDQAPAYAIAVDQLQARAEAAEKERDALKLENDMLNEQLEAAYPGMLRRMESAEKERDELRAQLTIAEANSATSRAALEEGLVYQKQLQSERNAAIARADRAESCIRHADEQNRAVTSEMLAAVKHSDELRAQLEAVTAERDDLAKSPDSGWRSMYNKTVALLHDAKCRIADLEAAKPRTFTDLEMQTGPVAFERNQLRDELAELRPQVEDLRAKLAAAEHRATMHERDAERMARAADTLETMFNAAISAVSRGNP